MVGDTRMASECGPALAATHSTGARLWRNVCRKPGSVDTLRKELEDDPGATTGDRKLLANAQSRTIGTGRESRQRLELLEAKQAKRNKKANQTQRRREPRASTSDAEATIMKMTDGVIGRLIMSSSVRIHQQADRWSRGAIQGNDSGLMGPMRQQIEQDYGYAQTNTHRWWLCPSSGH